MPDELTQDEQELRQRLCNVTVQLWARQIVSGDGGLISVKVNRRRYLVTPPGRRRALLQPTDILPIDMGGQSLTTERGLTDLVWSPHRVAYQSDRSELAVGFTNQHEVHATVLATPPHVMALLRLHAGDEALPLAEVGPVPLLDAADERAIRQAFEKLPAVVLSRRSVLCVGTSIEDAANAMERIEHAAMIEVTCHRLRAVQ